MGYFEHMDLYPPRRYEPRSDSERTDYIMRLLERDPATKGSPAADAADYGGAPSAWPAASESQRGAGVYRREYLPPDQQRPAQVVFSGWPLNPDPPNPTPDAIRSLGDEMVMLAAGLGGGTALARGLPFAVQMGRQGIASLTALSAEAGEAAAAISRSFMHRLGRLPSARELAQALGLAPDVGINQAEGLGNPFHGRTPEQVNEMMQAKGFDPRGENPVTGRGGDVNPRNLRSYHIQPKPHTSREGTEFPHVDVNRLRTYRGPLKKKKYPLGARLYDDE